VSSAATSDRRAVADAIDALLDDADGEELEEIAGMSPEAVAEEARSFGYDPSGRGEAIAAIRARTHAEPASAPRESPTRRTAATTRLADVVEAVLDEADREELEEIAAADPAELAAGARETGYDAKGRSEAIASTRAAAYAHGGTGRDDAAPSLARPPGKVVPLRPERRERVASTRWVPFLAAAAMVAVFASGASVPLASLGKPKVEYTTYVPPPSPAERAAPAVRWALRQCAMGYYGACRDGLDAAKAIDPSTESEPEVIQARKAIESEADHGAPGAARRSNQDDAKPNIAPWERPLKKTP
jgi:hypothetical protein